MAAFFYEDYVGAHRYETSRSKSLFLRLWARTRSPAGFLMLHYLREFTLVRTGRHERNFEICGGSEEILVGGRYESDGEIVDLWRCTDAPQRRENTVSFTVVARVRRRNM